MAAFKTHNLLPEIFRSDANQKFLNATLDQLISEPNFKKISGYIGRKFAPTYKSGDDYVVESTPARQHYQVEPAIVVNNVSDDSTEFYSDYSDLINKITYYGGDATNHSRLFSSDMYSYSGKIDFDKFVNFSQYCWLPNGPLAVSVTAAAAPTTFTKTVFLDLNTGQYYFDDVSTGNSELVMVYGGVYKFNLNGGTGPFWIQSDMSQFGVDPSRPNISVRQVFGVDNNGASAGTVIFKVPQPTTQNKFIEMGTSAKVDYATSLSYSELQGKQLSQIAGLDGVTGNIHQKTVVFVNKDHNDDMYWTVNSVIVPEVDRTQIWNITVVNGIISLSASIRVKQNEKVYVKSGIVNATRQFYVGYYPYFEEVPAITAPLTSLYYQNGSTATASGIIKLVKPADQVIAPSTEIEGKLEYTSPNGVKFTNGLKIVFDSSATADYAGKSYYVSGVGKAIKLIPTATMIAAERWADSSIVSTAKGSGYSAHDYLRVLGGVGDTPATIQVTNVSSTGAITSFRIISSGSYTTLPVNPVNVAVDAAYTTSMGTGAQFNLVLQPVVPDYLIINRASMDLNAWSRSNRWFHVDVIKFAAEFNGMRFSVDQNFIATRPIIEFQQNIKLFNHGTVAMAPVSLLDTAVTNAYVQVESASAANANIAVLTINGQTLTFRKGDRIIFSNDTNPSVRNKIYDFSIVDISDDEFYPKYISRITEANDRTIVNGSAVLTTFSDTADKVFWYDGLAWHPCQQKLSTSQAPLFDVYDINGVSFGDKTYYTNTSFTGTKIFSYKTGTGPMDKVLGFPLSYRSFNNVGDIQFTNNFDSESFTYLIGSVTHMLLVNRGMMHVTTGPTSFVNDNGWTVVNEKTKQYQLISNTADGVTNTYEIDILPEISNTIPNIKVLVNGKYLTAAQFGMMRVGIRYAVVIDPALLSKGASVDLQIYSNSVSTMGFYQVPANLDNNASNANFDILTLGQMRNHLVALYQNSSKVTGTVPGISNLRDIDIKTQGGGILKHSAPLIYSELFLLDPKLNFVDSIKLAQREYTKFKHKYLELSSQVEVNLADIPATADVLIRMINGIKNNSFAWYYSDMVPQGDAKVTLPEYLVLDPHNKSYELTEIFNDTVLSNKAVLIYLTRTTNGSTTKTLLAKDRDYTFSHTSPSLEISSSFNLNYDDILTVVEYSSTDGNYVPETPTKLGLYPKFVPYKYTDTTYLVSTDVIQGHDGSITPAFNDYRDALLLELELRIYNNIKIDCKFTTIVDNTPGKFRNTDYSLSEYNQVLTNSFLSWAGTNRLDFASTKHFDPNNAWTWNYKKFSDTIDGSYLPGSWRAVFMWLYDTIRPHTHPWELLGFTAIPNWWQDRYGPAPYTGGNSTLWKDLSQGYIHSGDRVGIDTRYARPGLLKVIPVDDAGNLLSPEKYAVLDFDSSNAGVSFAVGDIGPVEAAWRRSSDYPFAVQLAMALTKPAMYFSLFLNSDRVGFNRDLGQYLVTSINQHIRPSMIAVNGDLSSGTEVVRTAGYINWIADYLKNLGIGDPSTKIKNFVSTATVQLNYRVGGYTDKKFLKILAEQGSPSSINSSIIIPDENYKIILNKSSPIGKLVYSAVIIEKSPSGFAVSGYDLNTPYFTIIPSSASNNAYTIKAGKLDGTIFNDYRPVLIKIAYGHEFETNQQVVDFLVSYQRFLISQGFAFIDTDIDLGQKKDWVLSAKEFLTWVQQGWAPGNLLVLSPVKDIIRVASTDTVVDEITNSAHGSKILDPNFAVINSNNFSVVRVGNDFSLTSINGTTIAFANLSLVQYEHVIIFDNTTVFNDIIYSSDTGNRQYRLKFIGYKTADWTGVMNPPGFINNSITVDVWQSGQDYRRGALVTYKSLYYTASDNIAADTYFDANKWKQIDQSQIKTGLLPNLANSSKTFETIYDIDNQPYDSTINFYSNGIIGFRERGYLTDLLFEPETQAKFYQGYITQKGSMNAVKALSKAQINNSNNSIDVYEEWALRVGEYGATDSNQFVEVVLSDLDVTTNPTAIQLLDYADMSESGAVAYYPTDVYKSSRNNSPHMFDEYVTSAEKQMMPIAGYPHLDDVDVTIFDITDYRSLANSLVNYGTGSTIWAAKDFDGKWNVYRVNETGNSVVSISYSMDSIANVATNLSHGFIGGEIIALKGFSVVIDDSTTTFDGFYQVFNVIDSVTFGIVLTVGSTVLRDAGVIYDNAIIFKLVGVRLGTVAAITAATPLYGWSMNDRIWVDNATKSGWGVFQRTTPWHYSDTALMHTSEYVGSDRFGHAIKASANQQFVYVGAPNNSSGRVSSFSRVSPEGDSVASKWAQYSSFTVGGSRVSGFGEVLDLNDRALVIAASKSNDNAGLVYIYQISGNGVELVQCIASPVPASRSKFGASVCSSADGQWLFIGAPGANSVYMYSWVGRAVNYATVTIPVGALTFQASTALTAIEIMLTAGAEVLIPNVDYTITGSVITFSTPLTRGVILTYHSNYVLSKIISVIDVPAIRTGDNFGYSVSCDRLGRTLVVGAPTANGATGAAYVFNRSVEKFVARGNTDTFVTLRSLTLTSRVMVNDVLQTVANDYVILAGTIKFTAIQAAGSIISIETNYFSLLTKLESDFPATNQEFGSAVEVSKDASNIFVSAPGFSTATYFSGAVYRFTSPAKQYGIVTGVDFGMQGIVTAGRGIRVNGTDIILTGRTLGTIINDIDSAGIPGINASNVNGQLVISNAIPGVNVLSVLPGVQDADNTTFAALGIAIYTQTQMITHPTNIGSELFGVTAKISENGNTLVVSSLGARTVERANFDSYLTLFDSASTSFSHNVANSGAVYIFDLVDDHAATIDSPALFEYTQELLLPEMTSGIEFGAAIDIIGSSIFVGTPSALVTNNLVGGGLSEFSNPNNTRGWNLMRSEYARVDYESMARAFIYNKNSKSIVSNLDIYDPAKGKILGVADQDIDYRSELDPAIYNDSASTDNDAMGNYSIDFHWDERQLGRTWWDLSTVRFIDYEQGSLEYKNTHWGEPFLGSTFNVYEWIESDYIPSQYIAHGGDGIPYDNTNSNFVTLTHVDRTTNIIKAKYYFWVSGRTTIDHTVTRRTNSVHTIQQLLANPKDQGIPYIAAIASNAVSLFNVASHLSGQSIVLHLDHTPVRNTNIIHTEYALIKENADADIPARIVSKLQDSLAGINFAGHLVPDPGLSIATRYGIDIRPRQTMFVDRYVALANFVKYVNTIFALHPIANLRSLNKLLGGELQPDISTGLWDISVPNNSELAYIETVNLIDGYKVLVESDGDNDGLWAIYSWNVTTEIWNIVRIQSFLTKLYFTFINWYAPAYNRTAAATYTVGTYPAIGKLTLRSGDTVRVIDNGDGHYAVYKVNATMGLDQVAAENGTIQLLPILYDLAAGNMGFDNDNFDTKRFDQNPILETREVFSAVVDDILIKDLRVEFNKLFFSLVNYVYTEQQAPDWIFKTSFISVIHKIRDLAQYPSYIKDNQTYYEEYINEIKPYRTIIREYLPAQSTIDYLQSGATDFDLPSYYDTISATYRSPDGKYESDAAIIASDKNYAAWANNHLYKVVKIEVPNSGSNYTLVPRVTISGGGGAGAAAHATIANGKIVQIVVTNPGSGYTFPPVITVNGNGSGAILVPVLRNEYYPTTSTAIFPGYNTVRGIETSLKFDRVLDSDTVGRITIPSVVVQWKANTAVQAATIAADTRSSNATVVYRVTAGKLIAHAGSVYLPHAAVAAAINFDPSRYELLSAGNVLVSNLTTTDRISSYYSPSTGMLGQSLPQLVSGIEYPGVLVNGEPYSEIPVAQATTILSNLWTDDATQVLGSESGAQLQFSTIGQPGPALASIPIDSTISSYFKDTLLGTRPEDILIDGGEYYDTYSSHAPEEMLPGQVFDALDIQVMQANTKGFSTDVFGVNSITIQNPGYGYTDAAKLKAAVAKGLDTSAMTLINVTINGIANARATPILAANGAVTSITIDSGGSKITANANPVVIITGSNVAAASATAILSQNTYDLIGWRSFYDMTGAVSYTRISNKFTTVLTHDLHMTDTMVGIADGTLLTAPSTATTTPGRVFINGELISYYKNYAIEPTYVWNPNTNYKVGTVITHADLSYVTTGNVYAAEFQNVLSSVVPGVNWLGQIRRAAEGTGAPLIHLAGRQVVDAGQDNIIPETAYVPGLAMPGAPETYIGDSNTVLFPSPDLPHSSISTISPRTITVTVNGTVVTNYKIVQLVPGLVIQMLQIGVDPMTPGFIPAAPVSGAVIVISATVEGVWGNLLKLGANPITFGNSLDLTWRAGIESGIPNLDPSTADHYPFIGEPSNDYVWTASPPVRIVVDGGGMMQSTTLQAQFIRGEI